MNRSARCFPARSPLPLILLLVLAAGLWPRSARANLPGGTEGCTLYPSGDPGVSQDGTDIPICKAGTQRCWMCDAVERDQSGWKFCVELPETGLPPSCSDVKTEFPSWWPDPNSNDSGPLALPPDLTPPSSWTGDDGGLDLGDGVGWSGGGGGGGHGCLHQCPPAYGPTKYAVLTPPHPPYIP